MMATPLCPYFGICGGCSLQHVDYPSQLENKKKFLEKCVKSGSKEPTAPEVSVFSGHPYAYRNRMDFIFFPGGIGLRKKGTWDKMVDIEKCPIANDQINKLLSELRAFFHNADSFDLKKHTGTFRYAVIRAPCDDSSISFVLNSGSQKVAQAVEKIKEFALSTSAKNVAVTYNAPQTDMSVSEEYFMVKGADVLKENYMERNFIFPLQGFSQNNTAMAEMMHQHCNQILMGYTTKNAHLLDLYGGIGTFGINNSSLFKSVTILESYPPAIVAARKNLESNDIKNAETIIMDAVYLKRLHFPKPLFVLTDPPRSGMHPKTIEQLNLLKPEAILYISCNVEQLGKDIQKFKGYSVKSVAMFDLFPQTPHIEAIAELVPC